MLEGGLVGTLVLYGAPATQATAGVLVYHAIAFWVPSLGGLWSYQQIRRRLTPNRRADSSAELPAIPRRARGTAATAELHAAELLARWRPEG